MENNVAKSPSGHKNEKEKSCGSSDDVSNEKKISGKDVNSWDRSTSSPNGVTQKCKKNDWDSSSECQVTMVEPFDNYVKELENWDSESDKGVLKPIDPPFKVTENILGSLDSFDLSEFSDIERSSLSEIIQNGSRNKNISGESEKSEELFVEDLEEFVIDNGLSNSPTVDENQNKVKDVSKEGEKVRSNQSEGSPEDTTIWMIPNSERTQSAVSDTKLFVNHDRVDIEKSDELSLKISKSYCGVELSKSKRKANRSCRSDSGYINSKRSIITSFLTNCEGVSPRKSPKVKVKDIKGGISGCENFQIDKSRSYFAEYECRAVTTNYDPPDKDFSDTSRSVLNSAEDIFSQTSNNVAEENSTPTDGSNSMNEDIVRNTDGARHSEGALTNLARTVSAAPPLDVLSLPDMTGRNSIKERQAKEKVTRRGNPSLKSRNDDVGSSSQSSNLTKRGNESWFLLDETGQYQPVTRNEVTILLNGRSADDVLQEKTEHVIPHTNFIDSKSSSGSLSNILTKESLQYILREDDKGGEGTSKKLIDLERKVENTLLYIQPSPNLTASIRLIPVDTEMVHIWRRRAKDSGSLLSSEIDLRAHSSQDSYENANQRNDNESNHFLGEMEKSEIDVPKNVESRISSTTRDLTTGTQIVNFNHLQTNSVNEYSELLIETRVVVDNLTNNFKILQSRLDDEMTRSLTLQEEISKLRRIIKILGKNTLDEKTIRELISDHQLSVASSQSLSTLKPSQENGLAETKDEDEITLKNKSTTEFETSKEKSKTEMEGLNENEDANELAMKNKDEKESVTENKEKTESVMENKEEKESLMENKEEKKSLMENKEGDELVMEKNEEKDSVVERKEEEQLMMEKKKDEQLMMEKKEEEQLITEKKEEEQLIAEKKEEEQLMMEKKEKEQLITEKKEEEQLIAEKKEEEQLITEKKEKEQLITEKKEEEQLIAEKKEEEQLITEKKEKEQLITEKKDEEQLMMENKEKKDLVMENKEEKEIVKKKESEKGSEIGTVQSYIDPSYITINVYTLEHSTADCCGLDRVQKTNSLVQTNLDLIEGKMKTLQEENDMVTKQNEELKKKLKEISLELEKYLTSNTEVDLPFEDEKEMDAIRDQVCNLKLELDTLKRQKLIREQELKTEIALRRNELEQKSLTLKEWSSAILETFQELENSKNKLEESGIIPDLSMNWEAIKEPIQNLKVLTSFIKQTTETLFKLHNENVINQEVLKEVTREGFLKRETAPNIIDGLDQVISGYTELIDQCRKSSGDGNKVMEDYFTVIMEKASLVEEIKVLKTENEMLLESQLEHYEKLKQTMIALKDKKNEIVALESTQRLSEEERNKVVSLLQICEEEKKYLKGEVEKKTKIIQDLMNEKREKDLELSNNIEKLKELGKEVTNFEKSCRLKDELIKELQLENDQLLNAGEMNNNQIDILKEEIKNLKTEKKQIEVELESMKQYINDSQKEMTEYITHLETVINNTQESLDKTKQKLKESNQSLIRLKNENDVLDKKHECDVKLYNKTKEELETLKEKLTDIEEKLAEVEEEKEKLHAKLEKVSNLEKEKSDELDAATKERKILLKENSSLKEKLEIFSRDKDESLKDQKDLINKYAILSKEVQKFQEKYRNVKTECNKRTDLIKYLEMMLRENLMEYNNRILCLERNISHIIEKIAACKNCMKEKHAGVDAEVRELRHQLEVTYQERQELENVVGDYYSVLKRLENEIQEKEKKMDELHVKLSQEQQKAVSYEINKSPTQSVQEVFNSQSDILKIKKLENQILTTENELLECRKQLQECEANHENEKKKLELTIADLKSELKRYQIRNEVMMKNLSTSNITLNGVTNEKRNTEGTIKNFQAMVKEIDEKGKKIIELNEIISNCKVEVKMRESDVENLKTKNICLSEEVKNLKDQLTKLQDTLSDSNKNLEVQQKEKNEMAEKLLQSIKLIMEERSTRQTLEALTAEKEKNFKEQIDHIKNELASKIKECEALSGSLEDKKKYSNKLQDDLKRMKSELITLRKRNLLCLDSESHKCCIQYTELPPHSSSSLTQLKSQNITSERLESCLRELKEVREMNLQLRKTEGQYQAKIVCLEDEIRDARLLIKELQGDLKTEKRSRKVLKNMIASANMEIEKCLVAKQLVSTVADKIKRHLDLMGVSSRELLSGFRSNEIKKSPIVVD